MHEACANDLTTKAEADERNERPQDDGSEPFEATVADATSRTSDAQAETEDPSPMPRWGSLSCSDLWSEAYERIKADPDHTELLVRFEGYIATAQDDSSQHDIGHAESPMQLAQIQERAKKSLEKLSNARVSFSIAGRTIVVREVVRKVIKAVTTFKDVISAAISGEPHAALAWAGVMVIIPVRREASFLLYLPPLTCDFSSWRARCSKTRMLLMGYKTLCTFFSDIGNCRSKSLFPNFKIQGMPESIPTWPRLSNRHSASPKAPVSFSWTSGAK